MSDKKIGDATAGSRGVKSERMIQREARTAEALANAFADSLKPGRHGTPIITERFGSRDGRSAGFVVTGSESGESYRVTVVAALTSEPAPQATPRKDSDE